MTAAAWLEARTAGAPDELRAMMRGAVDGGAEAEGRVAEGLLDAACLLLDRVLERPEARSAALPLLAADALLTHAFEAAVEDPEVDLADFAKRAGAAGRLGRMAAAGADG